MTHVTGVLTRSIWLVAASLCCSSVNAEINFADLVRQQNQQAHALQSEIAGYAAQSSAGTILLPNGQHPAMKELSATRTVVFLSRSMPEPSLLALLKQGSGRQDIVYVFRGWGDGPVTEMFRYAQSLIKKLPVEVQKKPPQIIVLPQAFRTYKITHVPAVIHLDSDNKWYLLQGMRTVDGAIGQIRARKFNIRLSQQYKVSEPDQAEVMRRHMQDKDLKPSIEAAQKGVRKLLNGTVDLPVNQVQKRYKYTPYVAAAADIVNPQTRAVLYPKGTRFNVLALDPQGSRALVVIDGRSRWQTEFARHLLENKPNTLVLYTKLGRLSDAGIPAYPLDKAMQGRLKVTGVPTYYRQNGYQFDVVTVQPKD